MKRIKINKTIYDKLEIIDNNWYYHRSWNTNISVALKLKFICKLFNNENDALEFEDQWFNLKTVDKDFKWIQITDKSYELIKDLAKKYHYKIDNIVIFLINFASAYANKYGVEVLDYNDFIMYETHVKMWSYEYNEDMEE